MRLVSATANKLTIFSIFALKRNEATLQQTVSAKRRMFQLAATRLILEYVLLPFVVYTTWAYEAYILRTAMKPKKDGYGEKEKSSFPLPENHRQKPGRRAVFNAVFPEAGLRADNRC